MKSISIALILAAAACPTAVIAQRPVGQTLSLSHAIHAVDDLDTTLTFYRDVFGIEGRALDFANPAVPLLTNAPGVTLRLSMVGLPGGARFEFTHFMGVERRPHRSEYTDPGAASLILFVRDIDGPVAAARLANATIVTTGGAPIEVRTSTGMARSIIFRDPDGFFLQLIETQPAPDAPEGNVQRVALAYTMDDATSTRAFYTGMLGIDLSGASDYVRDPAFARLVGAPTDVEFRKLGGTLPPAVPVEFTEFRGVPRSKFQPRVRDPGAPAMAIQVANIVGMLGQMKSAGVPVVSTNGELVDFGNGVHNIFVVDPNGMNLELFERAAPR